MVILNYGFHQICLETDMINNYARIPAPSAPGILSLLLLSFLFLASPATAGSRNVNVAEMTSRAGRVIHGTVSEVRNGVHPQNPGIAVTFVKVQVLETIKGASSREVSFMQFGNSTTQYATHLPRYSVGEEVVLFLYPESKLGLTSPVGEGQGKFTVKDDINTGRRILVNEQLNQAVFSRLDANKMSTRLGLTRAERLTVVQSNEANSRGLDLGSFRSIVRKLAANPNADIQ